MSIFIAIKSNDFVRLNTLINAENINTPDTVNGLTPLMYASKFGKKESVNLLLTRGANINAHDTYGLTSLMLAVMINKKDIVATLLDKGADVNVTAKNGSNAISIAIKNGFEDIVELLRSKGATEPIVSDFKEKLIKYQKKIKGLEELEIKTHQYLIELKKQKKLEEERHLEEQKRLDEGEKKELLEEHIKKVENHINKLK